MPNTRKLSDDASKIFDLLDSAKLGMLVTGGESGAPLRSRPMSFVEVSRDDMVVRMFSTADSPKEDELEKDARANISVMDPASQNFVSLSGLIAVRNDPELKMRLWKPIHLAWYPSGPTDADLHVLEFKIAGGDFWDAPSSRIVQFVGIAKAILTRETYTGGTVGHMGVLHV